MKSLFPAAVLAAFGLAVSTHAQSLSEAAKKAEEARAKQKQEQGKADQKKAEPAPTKVYTNRDLPSVAAPVEPSATKSAEPETPAVADAKRQDAIAARRAVQS